jgi:hypothetical protein
MDITYHLTGNLKRLRMPAVIENLETRLEEAKERNLGYLEFLSLLVQDEIVSRESNNLAGRIKKARIDPQMSFEAFVSISTPMYCLQRPLETFPLAISSSRSAIFSSVVLRVLEKAT